MDRLWGAVLPVPASAIHVLRGGERVEAGGRPFEVAFTPGHASHHVSYFNRETGIAFVGDTAGVKLRPDGYGLPPTPPPDIDLEAWNRSLDLIAAWRPDTLFLTHFGPVTDAASHLEEFRGRLEHCAALVRQSLAEWRMAPTDRKEATERPGCSARGVPGNALLELRRLVGDEESAA
jgi:glyoxylase-like metal-dependent hydrolase (beta-lactamase superfamily II)